MTTSSAPAARSSKPIRSSTSSAPSTSSPPSDASAAPSPRPRRRRGGRGTARARPSRRAGLELVDRRGDPRPSAGRRRGPRRAGRAAGCARRTHAQRHAPASAAAPRAGRRRRRPSRCRRRRRAPRGPRQRAPRAAARRGPRLEARAGRLLRAEQRQPDRLRRLDHRRPVAAAEPRAVTGRPSGSDRPLLPLAAERPREHARPCLRRRRRRAARRTSTPSTRAALRRARPRRRRGERTPLRLAGHASARIGSCLLLGASSASASRRLRASARSVAYERPSRARKIEPDADADRRLDRLQADPEREAARVGDAVLHEREARPPPGAGRRSRARAGRSSRRSSAPARGRPRRAAGDAERPHRRPDGEAAGRASRANWNAAAVAAGDGRAHDREPVARPNEQHADAAELVRRSRLLAPRGTTREREQRRSRSRARSPMLVSAQCGSFAVSSTQTTSATTGKRSNMPVRERPSRPASPRRPAARACAGAARRRARARRRGPAAPRSRTGRRRTPRRRAGSRGAAAASPA